MGPLEESAGSEAIVMALDHIFATDSTMQLLHFVNTSSDTLANTDLDADQEETDNEITGPVNPRKERQSQRPKT